ncbi:MAG: hypothetical protein ACREEE_11875, partial [Dongiaceae bacterium]
MRVASFSIMSAALALALAGCAGHEEARIAKLQETDPRPQQFSICHGNSCRLRSEISLTEAEWQNVREVFATPSADAVAERRLIANAIALLEVMVGRQAGTLDDAPGVGMHWNNDEQLDCVDETTNSTVYMRMMAAEGMLRFHTVGAPAHRFVLESWGPSNTATVQEIATGKRYAVDSFFLANGAPASVLPLDLWLDGWTPEDG